MRREENLQKHHLIVKKITITKMNKKTKNIIKVAIVFLMAGAIALSALAPIFASEDGNNERRISDIRRIIAEIRGEEVAGRGLSEADERKEEIEKKREEIRQKREALRLRITEIQANLDRAFDDFSATPEVKERKVVVRGIPSDFTFQNDLRERAKGDAVRYLQILLNIDPATRVATSGPGSPGNETTLFGENTRKALIRFQRKYSISASGFFGSQSRVKANEILRNGLTIREVGQKDLEPIRRSLLESMEMIKEVKEELELIHQKEASISGGEVSFDYRKDIEDAQNYAKEQMVCTMEVREMRSNNHTYIARNGCEISFLAQRGWE